MSNTEETARPESWEALTQWAASRTDSPAADCIIELRARVERLEQAQQQGNSSAILTSSPPAPSTPAGQGELVSGVAEAMDATPWVFRGYAHVDAAILAVADWFAKQGWGIAATMLRREVGR